MQCKKNTNAKPDLISGHINSAMFLYFQLLYTCKKFVFNKTSKLVYASRKNGNE